MNKLDKSNLLTLEEYSSSREQIKKKALAIKKNRRIQIGRNITLLFENLDTIKYQIQEILRIEKIIENEGIEKELSLHNQLIPDGNNLKATMLMEFLDQKVRLEKLSLLTGIEDKVWLQVGENDRVFAFADEDADRKTRDKTSTIHFLRFEFSNLMVKELQLGTTLFAGVDHPNYNVRTQEITKTTSNSLAKDLTLFA